MFEEETKENFDLAANGAVEVKARRSDQDIPRTRKDTLVDVNQLLRI